ISIESGPRDLRIRGLRYVGNLERFVGRESRIWEHHGALGMETLFRDAESEKAKNCGSCASNGRTGRGSRSPGGFSSAKSNCPNS
ncbi:hypothetical protein FRC01_008573, partial [Tulasnella sp. 417]